jgi:hypothetical protein
MVDLSSSLCKRLPGRVLLKIVKNETDLPCSFGVHPVSLIGKEIGRVCGSGSSSFWLIDASVDIYTLNPITSKLKGLKDEMDQDLDQCSQNVDQFPQFPPLEYVQTAYFLQSNSVKIRDSPLANSKKAMAHRDRTLAVSRMDQRTLTF